MTDFTKENYPNVFYKDMTDMNTQESFIFMLRPFIINDEYYGTMAYMFDDKKILQNFLNLSLVYIIPLRLRSSQSQYSSIIT